MALAIFIDFQLFYFLTRTIPASKLGYSICNCMHIFIICSMLINNQSINQSIYFQVSSKDEDFLDLSVDVEQNTSITHCLRGFSSTETLCSEQKYYCEVCCSKQEAQKRCVKFFERKFQTIYKKSLPCFEGPSWP